MTTGPIEEPTDDTVPDGTQLPVGGDDEPNQDADAGVEDTGTEEWYGHTVPKGEI